MKRGMIIFLALLLTGCEAITNYSIDYRRRSIGLPPESERELTEAERKQMKELDREMEEESRHKEVLQELRKNRDC